MDFNVLPRARILSPHTKQKMSQTTNQTVNVILPQQTKQQPTQRPPTPPPPQATTTDENTYPPHEPEMISEQNPYKNLQPGEVEYVSRDVVLDEPAEKISTVDATATINFLKLVVAAYMNNPIKYNGYVICSVPVLENLIETLTSCDNCDVEITDIEAGCCGTSTAHIVPINKIWVEVGGNREVFKYKYSQFLQTFEQFNISLKFVYIE